MRKIILVPDSFKGSLSAAQFCTIASEVIARHFPHCEIISIPVADGGEGSVDCFLTAKGGRKCYLEVSGPLGEPVQACYGVLPDGEAVIEMAAAAGLPLLKGKLNVLHSHTFGVGQMICAALDQSCRQLIVGLGGSCTNDGGCGAAAALGVQFFNARGEAFIPAGGTLTQIAAIDVSLLDKRLQSSSLNIMCDIENPMHGATGAAHVFGPQKGADEATVTLLDEGLRHLDALIQRDLGLSVAGLPGSGAAGAMGAGLVAFCGGRLRPGIEIMLDTVDFDRVVQGADLIISGEGRLDSQSLGGKVIIGVCLRAKLCGKPVLALAGSLESGFEPAYGLGLTAAFAITPQILTLAEAMEKTPVNLASTLDNLCRLFKCMI